MSTGSKALDRTIMEWLGNVQSGRLRLPSFQRGVAWDRRRVASMLNTIIRDLPLGITLVLDVGDDEKFHSRPLDTAPHTDVKVSEHLLDGQQRLTALWKALRDKHEREIYFIHVPELDSDPNYDDAGRSVWAVPSWTSGTGERFPKWAGDPVGCLQRGFIPVRLLDPYTDNVADWVEKATGPYVPGDDITDIGSYKRAMEQLQDRRSQLKDGIIGPLRETLKHYNLPYLRLPASTPRDVALSVFVNMNTNAKPLKAYDIIVAEVESRTRRRLHEMVSDVSVALPALGRYGSVGDLMLQTGALLQGKPANQTGLFDMNLDTLVRDWDDIAAGLRRVTDLLERANLFDAERLPSAVPLPVLGALLTRTPHEGDQRAFVDRLARRYMWSSFFTSRYETTAGTRAAADYRGLRGVLEGRDEESAVPVLDRAQHPLPTASDLIAARWPKAKRTLARAILASSTYFGARDFADDTRISAENVKEREYHHLFPDKLLTDAQMESSLALNCVLITWKTNRTIGRLDPIAYLEARAERAPNSTDVKKRLDTHLVPFGQIELAGPYPMTDPAELRAAVEPHFAAFLHERATLVLRLANLLCHGEQPELADVISSPEARHEIAWV